MTKQKKLLSALIVLLSFAAVILFTTYFNSPSVSSVIGIDVNPSIEINLDKDDKVISVTTLNEDGEKVLGDMDLAGTNLDVAINALVGSLMQNGYLTDQTNSVLINVESENDDKEDLLNKTVSTNIQNAITAQGLEVAVINSELDDLSKEEAEKIAQENDISNGKANLINSLLKLNPNYSEEELSALNITQLTLLLDESDDIKVEGVVSTKDYITTENALEIAKTHAGVLTTTNEEFDFDFENGKFIYEVEFTADFIEYEYDIDAVTGEVLNYKNETDDDINENTNTPAQATITKEKALETALNHAGVTDYVLEKNELDNDDGVLSYEIEFKSGTTEFEYDINAVDGSVISFEKDLDDDLDDMYDDDFDDDKNENTNTPAQTTITKEKALEIALNHAGVTDYVLEKNELDNDDGILSYEIEFKSGTTEFEYDINAVNGSVISFEKDLDDDLNDVYDDDFDDDKDDKPVTNTGFISQTNAIEIAKSHAGVSDVYELKAELDNDDGVSLYEIEFKSGNTEYEYDIDAAFGAIITFEHDIDD